MFICKLCNSKSEKIYDGIHGCSCSKSIIDPYKDKVFGMFYDQLYFVTSKITNEDLYITVYYSEDESFYTFDHKIQDFIIINNNYKIKILKFTNDNYYYDLDIYYELFKKEVDRIEDNLLFI